MAVSFPGLPAGAIIKGVELFCCGATGLESSVPRRVACYGLSDGVASYSVGYGSENGQATMDTLCNSSAVILRLPDETKAGQFAIICQATIASFAAVGPPLSLHFDTVSATRYEFFVRAWAGDDVNAKLHVGVPASGNGNSVTVTTGWPVDVAVGLSSVLAAHPDLGTAGSRMTVGLATMSSGIQQFVARGYDADGVSTSSSEGKLRNDRFLIHGFAGTDFLTVEITNPTATGFDLTTRDQLAPFGTMGVLAIGLGDRSAKVIGINPAASVGDEAFTGMGFKPDTLMGWITKHTSFNALNTTGGGWGSTHAYVHANAGLNRSLSLFSEDGQATSKCGVYRSDVAWHHLDDDGLSYQVCTVKSFDSDGFTLAKTVVPALATPIWVVLGIEEGAEAGVTKMTFYMTAEPPDPSMFASKSMRAVPVLITYESASWYLWAAMVEDDEHHVIVNANTIPAGFDGSIADVKRVLRQDRAIQSYWIFAHYLRLKSIGSGDIRTYAV